jgi:hypothetical protein
VSNKKRDQPLKSIIPLVDRLQQLKLIINHRTNPFLQGIIRKTLKKTSARLKHIPQVQKLPVQPFVAQHHPSVSASSVVSAGLSTLPTGSV